MRLVFLGPPGAGKGTIAAIVSKDLGIPHISTGDLFREAIKNKTELGKKVESILASGELVPDKLTIALVKDRLSKEDAKEGFILDGFPRTIVQADGLAEFSSLDYVVNFDISDEAVIKRLSGRRVCPSTGRVYHIEYNPPKVEGKDDETGEDLIIRPDDQPEAIKNRLEVYKKQTAPLIAYYTEKGLIKNIPANMAIEDVAKAVKEAIVS
ncbi:adenylate kinase [Spirochaetia bacterium 38H-sp]|uniref:Adenylate kinase n=1 Tax=Rarispira pelagica TaxID=3141764 RepID=A0ABU9UCX7_9SPIR